MSAHGYIFKGFAAKVGHDYIPSLIGAELGKATGTDRDAYFERVEIEDRTVKSITGTRWFQFDSAHRPHGESEPIVAVTGNGLSYYIPLNELEEIAAENHDDDTIQAIKVFRILG